MPIGVDGDLNRAMSKLFLDVGEGCAVLDQERGEGMPYTVYG